MNPSEGAITNNERRRNGVRPEANTASDGAEASVDQTEFWAPWITQNAMPQVP